MWYNIMSVRPGNLVRRCLVLWMAGLLLAACGDEGSGPADPVVATVVVQGDEGLVVGDERTYAVRALDAGGREITGRMVAWTSTVPAVATVSATGVVTALSPGATEVRATVDGVVGTSTLEVTLAPVATITLNVSDVHVWPGEMYPLTAVARDGAGRVLIGRTRTWSSASVAVATVDADGQVTAVAPGQTQVHVAIGGVTATAQVTVGRRPVASIAVSPGTPVLTLGEAVQLRATVKDAAGGILEDRPVTWSVDNGNATVSETGLLTAVRDGYVTVTARSEGISTSVGATIIDDAEYEHDLLYHRHTAAGVSELFVLALGTGLAPVRLNAGTVSKSATSSPEGTRIAFAVAMDEPGTGQRVDDIYAIDRIGGLNIRRLTSAPGIDDEPAWSPVGARIAYRHAEAGGRSDIWVMNADGSAPINLTGGMDASSVRSSPAWSRDGTRLAFSQLHNGPAGTTTSIWTMKADGSDKVQVTNTLTGFDASPTWSPNGSQLAFVRYYGGDADITILRLSDGVTTRVPLEGNQAAPAWSPDGWLIAFVQSVRGIDELFTMRADGKFVRLRTSDRGWGGGLSPSWIRRF
ncbi:MAG: Ig-like domain-containing protein [Gemmatimonadales bacterium]